MTIRSRMLGRAIDAYLSPEWQAARQRLGDLRRRLGGARPQVVFYHRMDDPYSSLLLRALPRLMAGFDVDVEAVIVPPPDPEANPEPARLGRYALQDVKLLVQHLELEFPADATPPAKALVARSQEVALQLPEGVAGLQALGELDEAVWSGDLGRVERLAGQFGTLAPATVAERLQFNAVRLHTEGHYQGGMLRWNGEWFWGVDRLQDLADRLAAAGAGAPTLLVPRRAATAATLPAGLPRRGRPSLVFYFSFRSPYSYLAVDRMLELAVKYPVDLEIRPVMPMVRRGLAVPRGKRLYIVRDARREAAKIAVPFGRICDPLEHVERPMAIFPLAQQAGLGAAFVQSVARGIWAEAADIGNNRDLRRLSERAGLRWREAKKMLRDERWRAAADRNRQELEALGLWGVPSFQLGTLAMWGQDRIWILERLLRAWQGSRR